MLYENKLILEEKVAGSNSKIGKFGEFNFQLLGNFQYFYNMNSIASCTLFSMFSYNTLRSTDVSTSVLNTQQNFS